MQGLFVVGNWKMHKTPSEARDFALDLVKALGEITDVEVAIAPSFVSLSPVWEVIKGSNIKLCAQDVFWEKEGAYTGEVSPLMLKDVGCEYVIIGHSERRRYFKETDEDVNKKLKAVISEGLKPIICIGETLEEREKGETFTVLKKQLTIGLNGIATEEFPKVTIAYEPVWAIGTGRNATPDQIKEAHYYIRSLLKEKGFEKDGSIRILYGGSVTPDNIDELIKTPGVDGVLVGGASLKVSSFVSIVKAGRKG